MSEQTSSSALRRTILAPLPFSVTHPQASFLCFLLLREMFPTMESLHSTFLFLPLLQATSVF